MKFGVSNVFQQQRSLLFLLSILSGSSFLSFSGSLLGGCLGLTSSVKVEGVVLSTNWNDQTLLGELFDESSCDGSTNLELFNENSSGDAKDLWNFFKHSFELFIIKEDGIVELFLYLGLSP